MSLRILIVPALVCGCVTSSEGEAMRAETAALRTRLDAMDRRDAEAKEQVIRLRRVLDEATALLTRNSADVGAKLQRAEADLATLSGRVAELQHALTNLEKLQGRLQALEQSQQRMAETQQKVVDRVAPAIPEDKTALWNEAVNRMSSGQNEEARRFYRAYVQRFPQDPKAPQALIAIGESFVAERKYPQAAGEFQKILDAYPRAPEVPDAMWHLGATFVELKFCSDAKALLSDLARRYPKSPRSPAVKQRIKEIEKLSKDRTRCTS